MAAPRDWTAAFLPSAAASSLFGSCEWLLLRPEPAPGGLQAVILPLLAAAAVYGAFGAFVAAGARLVNRFRPARTPPIDPVAATLSTLLVLAALARFSRDPFSMAAALALGAVVYLALARGVRRFPRLAGGVLSAAALLSFVVSGLVLARLGYSVDPRVGGARPPAGDSSPAVLLVTIDTLRADRLGVYGHDGARTPYLDTLATSGARFREAVTHSPWTGPSHCSILTGLLPQSHRVRVNGMSLPPEVPTLADDLARRGYRTGAFVSGWPLKDEVIRLASRFQTYSEGRLDLFWRPLFEYGSLTLFRYLQYGLGRAGIDLFFKVERDASEVSSSAVDWIEESAGEPFFAWVHYYDPHLPYEAPVRYRTAAARSYSGSANGAWYSLDDAMRAAIVSSPDDLEQMYALYDAEIAFVDAEIGPLVKAARRAAPPEGLLVVVTSDHGEDMGEHDRFFSRDLYEPTLRVPLIIVPPDRANVAPSVVDAQVRLVDLTPTILDLLDVEAERSFDGRSIASLMENRTGANGAPAISVFDPERRGRPESYAIRHDGWKLIQRAPGWEGVSWRRSRTELYDLRSDPAESNDLAREKLEFVARLEEQLRPYVKPNGRGAVNLDPDQIRSLRALGYLQ